MSPQTSTTGFTVYADEPSLSEIDHVNKDREDFRKIVLKQGGEDFAEAEHSLHSILNNLVASGDDQDMIDLFKEFLDLMDRLSEIAEHDDEAKSRIEAVLKASNQILRK